MTFRNSADPTRLAHASPLNAATASSKLRTTSQIPARTMVILLVRLFFFFASSHNLVPILTNPSSRILLLLIYRFFKVSSYLYIINLPLPRQFSYLPFHSPTVTSSGSRTTGGSPTGGSGSGRNGTVSAPTTTPAGNSASSLNVMGGALALVVLTAGFVL